MGGVSPVLPGCPCQALTQDRGLASPGEAGRTGLFQLPAGHLGVQCLRRVLPPPFPAGLGRLRPGCEGPLPDTVAKQRGFLGLWSPCPLTTPELRAGLGEGLTLTSLGTPVLPMLPRRLPGKGVGAGLGAWLGTRLGVRERDWPSQYSEDAVELPGRSRRSSRLWLPRSG